MRKGSEVTPWRGRWWLYAVAWLPFLTIYLALFLTNGLPVGFAVRGAFANVLPDALLGLGLLRLPRQLPWPERRRGQFFAAHAGLLVAFILASGAGWAALVLLDAGLFRGSWSLRIDLRVLPWRVLNDLLVYVGLAGLGYAWQNAARASRAEALQARAELQALRSQLNPHFILNTFHALVGLVRRDPAVAEQALEQLGDLLRYSLRIQREGLDEVTLRDEWSFVRSYLDLEGLRLGDRLRVTFEAEDGTLDCIVPSFALQTLVENSIRHAIAPRAAGGRLAVSVRRVEDRLRIRVEDEAAESGPGLGLGSVGLAGDGQGVGLRLLRERLAALYGGGASLDLAAAPGGVGAVLDLPSRHLREGE